MESYKDRISLRDVLQYSPYDLRFDLTSKGISDELFYNQLFVHDQQYENLLNVLNESINSLSNSYRPFTVVSGFSGSGKTTFINWAIKRLSDNYAFTYLNTSEFPIFSNNPIKQSLLNQLSNSPLNDTINLIVRNENILVRFFDYDIDDLNIWDDIILAIQKGLKNTRKLYKLLEKIPFKQLLLVFFIHKTLNESKKDIIICFDNLDALNIEYLSVEIWKDILFARDAFLYLQSNKIFSNYKSIAFILVFREANYAVANPHANDRTKSLINTINFELADLSKQIIDRRIRFARELQNNELTDLISIINEDIYSESVFIPLFNYDIRKYLSVLMSIDEFNSLNIHKKKDSLIDFNNYINLTKHSKSGARNIILHYIIKKILKDNIYNKIDPLYNVVDSSINYFNASNILTLLINLSFPNSIPNSKNLRNSIALPKIDLYNFISVAKKFVNYEVALDLLATLFNLQNSEWANLITIYNKELDNNYSINFSHDKRILDILINSNTKEKNIKYQNEIEKVKLQINYAGYIYHRNVCVTFEYYSVMLEKYNLLKNSKPLFLAINKINGVYEFYGIIEAVTKALHKSFSNYRYFLESKFSDLSDFKDFLNDTNVFNIFVFRSISSQIQYLDDFRMYLHEELNDIKELKESQKYIISIIKDNISLLESFCNEHDSISIRKQTSKFLKNIHFIEDSGYSKTYHKIN